jgi:hypothetical protein
MAHPATVEYVGPLEHRFVVVRGRVVEYLSAIPLTTGGVSLTLDHRFRLDLSADEAERFIPFLADCMAVAAGYASHPGEEDEALPLPRFRRLHRIETASYAG